MEFFSMYLYHANTARSYRGDFGYFAVNDEIYPDYREMVDTINASDCERVGLWISETIYEYPLTQMLLKEMEIEHVNVTNRTAIYADESFVPDFVICYGVGQKDEVSVGDAQYEQVLSYDKGGLWKKAE